MSEIIAIGKTVSLFLGLVLYWYMCSWSVIHQLNGDSKRWKKVVSAIFIGIHMIFAMIFLIWCWTK